MALPLRLAPSGPFVPVAQRFLSAQRASAALIVTTAANPNLATALVLVSRQNIRQLGNERIRVRAMVQGVVAGGVAVLGIAVRLTPTLPAGPAVISAALEARAVPIGETGQCSFEDIMTIPGVTLTPGTIFDAELVAYCTGGGASVEVSPGPAGNASLSVEIIDSQSAAV